MKEQRRTWYVLRSRGEYIKEMWFTHYAIMQDYWKHLPLKEAGKCYWTIEYR